MASKSRSTNGEFTLKLSHLEMLKLEKLMKLIGAIGPEHFDNEELEWASNAQQIFAPELSSGGFQI